MAVRKTAVSGIYPDRPAVEEAIACLRAAGFRSTEVSVLRAGGREDEAGVSGWLTGAGALAIPGLGVFIAAGPVVAALAGAGGIPGALAGMGIPENEAKRCEKRIREGGVLLSVECDSTDWIKRARDILHT